MIYVTGDVHGSLDIGKLNTKRFPQQKSLTKSDYVIACGDFGLVWDNRKSDLYWREWLSEKPFTTLWVDGNHENFDLLYQFPVTEKIGGKVREIAPAIFHLERGQELTFDGKTCYVMGRAESRDKAFRKEHISWWKEEMPTIEEMWRGIDALNAYDWSVDYVISHCAPRSVQIKINKQLFDNDPLVSFLEAVRLDLDFKKWFFGHYHVDKQIGDRFWAIYNNIVAID